MNEQRGLLLIFIGSLLFLAGLMLKPFLGYILGAMLLAFVLMPLQDRLARYVGQGISALTLIILTFVAVSVPFVLMFGAVADDAQDIASDINQTELLEASKAEKMIKDYTGQDVNIGDRLREGLTSFTSSLVGSFSSFLNILTNIAIGFSVMLFVLYYFLKDGRSFTNYLRELIPLPGKITRKLELETYRTTWAVMKGHVLVAIIQGLVAGAGLWVTGIPNAAFWTFIMILLAFIPIIGAFMVWGPAAVYLWVINRPASSIFLMIYGTVVVGLTDNFLRPILVDREVNLHPAVILIGVIGGVYIFGAAGLFVGPVIFGVLKAVLEVFEESYEEL
jgi:predicted PurR-regulated permease PerM